MRFAQVCAHAASTPFAALRRGRTSFRGGLSVVCGRGKAPSNISGTLVALSSTRQDERPDGALRPVSEPTPETNSLFLTASTWESFDERETAVRPIGACPSPQTGGIPAQGCRWEQLTEGRRLWTRHDHDERGTGPGKLGTPAGDSSGLLGFWASHRNRAWWAAPRPRFARTRKKMAAIGDTEVESPRFEVLFLESQELFLQ